MKAFLAFLSLIALASATHTPTWTQCGDQVLDLNITSISFDIDPNNANNTFVSACGDVNSHHGFTAFQRLIVNGTYENGTSYVLVRAFLDIVPSGTHMCLDVSSDSIEYAPKDVSFRMAAFSLAGYQAACVDVVVKYSDSGFKFLGKRQSQLKY